MYEYEIRHTGHGMRHVVNGISSHPESRGAGGRICGISGFEFSVFFSVDENMGGRLSRVLWDWKGLGLEMVEIVNRERRSCTICPDGFAAVCLDGFSAVGHVGPCWSTGLSLEYNLTL